MKGNIAANLFQFKKRFNKHDKTRNKQTDYSAASQSGSNVSGGNLRSLLTLTEDALATGPQIIGRSEIREPILRQNIVVVVIQVIMVLVLVLRRK